MADFRVHVGTVEVVSLLDVPFSLPPERMFPSTYPQDWESYQARHPEWFVNGNIRTNATGYVVRSQGRTILVDTGLGPGPHQMAGGATGNLLADMQGKGVQPQDIDLVIVTHLHGDHVGWNATPVEGGVRPTFPRARYLIPQADWDHFRQPAVLQQAPALQNNVIALHGQGLVDLVSGEQTITDEVTVIPTPGHTPGHQSVMVVSQGQQAAIIGDVAHTPVQAEHTDWSPGFDTNPNLSRRVRHQVFYRVEKEGAVLCACHFPNPGFGRLVRVNGRRVFQAL